MVSDRGESKDWQRRWKTRKSVLESVLGATDGTVLHAVRPFNLGGAADILSFRKAVPGRISVTCELLGEKSQIANRLGNYELMIAHRDDEDWGPKLIARLARYTCEKMLEPGHTMDIGTFAPKGSTIAALLFDEYANFIFDGRPAGLLLCIGITESELRASRAGKQSEVFAILKTHDIYPYTDLFRCSCMG